MCEVSSYHPALELMLFISFKHLIESQLITDDDFSFQERGENNSTTIKMTALHSQGIFVYFD